jgi:hypothetical protein
MLLFPITFVIIYPGFSMQVLHLKALGGEGSRTPVNDRLSEIKVGSEKRRALHLSLL